MTESCGSCQQCQHMSLFSCAEKRRTHSVTSHTQDEAVIVTQQSLLARVNSHSKIQWQQGFLVPRGIDHFGALHSHPLEVGPLKPI